MMKQYVLILSGLLFFVTGSAQVNENEENAPDAPSKQGLATAGFSAVKKNTCTPVKDQSRTGTCWSFAGTSLVESQAIKQKAGTLDLSEMYAVRQIYIEKAKNYILRQGNATFSQGALGHDLIQAFARYGIMPESAYKGLPIGHTSYDHDELFRKLKRYVDSTLKTAKAGSLTADWTPGYIRLLDEYMGVVPDKFNYNGKQYSPAVFAREVVRFSADDYVSVTSFTHHPYQQSFMLEVPDNFSNGRYMNLPLSQLIQYTQQAVSNGYTVLWDADVSNAGFDAKAGLALHISTVPPGESLHLDLKEDNWNVERRQQLFENLTTQDDHLMHIVGVEKDKAGRLFFIVKNSWGNIGPYNGYVHVSEAYFAMNTISLIFPKASLPPGIDEKR